MELTNSIQKFTFPKEVIIESQCVFEIEKFRAYKIDEKLCSMKVEFFDGDIKWWTHIYPSKNWYNTTVSQLDVVINVKSEELRKSKKYQFEVSATLKGFEIFKSGFKSIVEADILETLRLNYDDTIEKLTPNGSFVVVIKLKVKHLGDPLVCQILYSSIDAKQQLPKQFSNILTDGTFSDFAFIVKGKEFKVHKAIVASVSEMMRNMFTTNLKELAQGQCIVDDIEPNIFEQLLRYIYVGEISVNLGDISNELFKAAHYYGIVNLIEICKRDIHLKLCANNALETCLLASLYDVEDIKIDAWNIAKVQVLKIFFPLENEPLPTEELRQIINIKEQEKAFWLKHKKGNLEEEAAK